MSRLRDDLFSRRPAVAPERRRASFTALALMIVSVGLLVLSRVDHSGLKSLRWQAAELFAPLLSAVIVPLEPVRWAGRQIDAQRNLTEENTRLRDQNARLSGWESRARDLEQRLAALQTLAKVVVQTQTPFVTGRVIADSSGPFVRAAIVDAGREHNLRSGNPVIGAEGLVGRILETGKRASRVLLLTDSSSRIPVAIGERGVRAILAGDNGPIPRILMLPTDARPAAGEEVVTSGIGGMFPRGLRIGRIIADTGTGHRVEPHARLDDLDYVSVLLIDATGIDVSDETRSTPIDARSRRAQIRGGEDER